MIITTCKAGPELTELLDEQIAAERYRWLRNDDNWGEDSKEAWLALGELFGEDFDKFIDDRRLKK